MNEPDSFLDKIKELFFDPNGRFSRETFAITLVGLLLFASITSPLLYKLCGLFLPVFLINLLALGYVGYIIYAFFIIYIKRLHDLNQSGWLSLIILFPVLNFFFTAYLCLKDGAPGQNKYGDPLVYDGPSALLVLCYIVLGVYALGTVAGLVYWKKLRNIPNTGEGVQKVMNIMPKSLTPDHIKEELSNKPRALGLLFIDNQFTTPVVSITPTRVLVRGTPEGQMIKAAVHAGKKVTVRFSDNSSANVIKFIAADNSPSVQMIVFEMDQPLGMPADLNEKNRQLLENMNAF